MVQENHDNWQRYLEASRRKAAIAVYHADCVEKELTTAVNFKMDTPSIPIQAHFEGVIVSVMAAVDQVAQALNSALHLGLNSGNLVDGSFASITDAIPEVRSWFGEPIGRDLRRIRVRMVHYSYAKTPKKTYWVVESAGTDFSGSRELVAYARSAVEYIDRLVSMIPMIETEIGRRVAMNAAADEGEQI